MNDLTRLSAADVGRAKAVSFLKDALKTRSQPPCAPVRLFDGLMLMRRRIDYRRLPSGNERKLDKNGRSAVRVKALQRGIHPPCDEVLDYLVRVSDG